MFKRVKTLAAPRKMLALLTALTTALGPSVSPAFAASKAAPKAASTSTPIQHLVVIFQENVSFDHYFGTYPNAANTDGTPFHASAGTPTVNGLPPALLSANPNTANPQRIPSAIPLTCDQGHGYTQE